MSETVVSPTAADVQHADLGVSDQLNRVVRTIVRNKYILDNAVADQGAGMLARDLHGSGYGTHEPMPFLRKILPFAYASELNSEYRFSAVPTANTIGCSWRWRRKHIDGEEAQRLCEKLSTVEALVDGTMDEASYAWIKPLGLFVPLEGKNRVDFFREEGIATIPAKIHERSYPEPNRIVIYHVQKNGFSATWAVLDGRWVEYVPNPSWTLPLMSAYGVNATAEWPLEFPESEKVQLACRRSMHMSLRSQQISSERS